MANKALPKCSLLVTKLDAAMNHPGAGKVPGFAVKAAKDSSKEIEKMLEAARKVVGGKSTTLPYTLEQLASVAATAENNAQLFLSMAVSASKFSV